MTIAVLGQHAEARMHFARAGIGPFVPDPAQGPGLAVRAPEAPPDVLLYAPVRLIEAFSRNEAALTVLPCETIRPGRGHGFAPGVVRAHTLSLARHRDARL